MNKTEIRSIIRKKLFSQSREEIKEKSQVIMDKLFENKKFKRARKAAVYLAKPYEVDTNYTLRTNLGEKEFSVPVTDEEVKLVKLTSFEDLIRGKFDVFEPREREYIDYIPEVVVIPGIAFDKSKNRLGHGKGFYDTFLEGKQAYKIGIAFDFQVIENIPSDPHDVKMDLIITEKRMI